MDLNESLSEGISWTLFSLTLFSSLMVREDNDFNALASRSAFLSSLSSS